MSKKKPPEPFFKLTDERICRDDHLRIARDAALDVGPASIVMAAVYIASADGKCFPSQEKLAKVACCSVKTVERAISPRGPLVTRGWLEYFGREPFSKHSSRVRRTVSVRLTKKAIKALETRYHALPRAVLSIFKKPRLTWSESLVLAEICSRHLLTLAIEGAACVGRECVSISSLQRATGLPRRSIIRARQGLVAKGAITLGDTGRGGIDMWLHEQAGLYESMLPPTAVEVLRSTSEPPRDWKPSPPKRDTRAKAPPEPNSDGVPKCRRRGSQSGGVEGAKVSEERVPICRSWGCQSVGRGGAKVSVAMTNLLDQPLGPTSLIETPETSLGRDDSIDQAEEKLATDDKALRRKIAPLELRHFPKMTGAEKAAHLRLPLTEQLAILQEKDRAAR